jgi:hypothetical protein
MRNKPTVCSKLCWMRWLSCGSRPRIAVGRVHACRSTLSVRKYNHVLSIVSGYASTGPNNLWGHQSTACQGSFGSRLSSSRQDPPPPRRAAVPAMPPSDPSPHFLQNTLKRGLWSKTHGSILIQEGQACELSNVVGRQALRGTKKAATWTGRRLAARGARAAADAGDRVFKLRVTGVRCPPADRPPAGFERNRLR